VATWRSTASRAQRRVLSPSQGRRAGAEVFQEVKWSLKSRTVTRHSPSPTAGFLDRRRTTRADAGMRARFGGPGQGMENTICSASAYRHARSRSHVRRDRNRLQQHAAGRGGSGLRLAGPKVTEWVSPGGFLFRETPRLLRTAVHEIATAMGLDHNTVDWGVHELPRTPSRASRTRPTRTISSGLLPMTTRQAQARTGHYGATGGRCGWERADFSRKPRVWVTPSRMSIRRNSTWRSRPWCGRPGSGRGASGGTGAS